MELFSFLFFYLIKVAILPTRNPIIKATLPTNKTLSPDFIHEVLVYLVVITPSPKSPAKVIKIEIFKAKLIGNIKYANSGIKPPII